MRVQNLPRHLGQHSGGMVVAMGKLSEVVPLEPAAMEGRVVIQWDKDDCADLGIVKVDLLGLGMLGAIEKTLPMIEAHEGEKVDLAHLPHDDPKVYEMLRAADTIGLFQVESRAQMASLPATRRWSSTTSSCRSRSSGPGRSWAGWSTRSSTAGRARRPSCTRTRASSRSSSARSASRSSRSSS